MTLWREISQTLAQEIDDGVLTPGDRLPASSDLAVRFGVNRHTVLKAISHLQEEGLLRTERGGGIYVESVIPYRMGPRTRLEENLLELNRLPSRELISIVDTLPAPKVIAEALEIPLGSPVALVTVLGAADGVPISYNRNYFPVERLPGISEAFRAAERSGGSLVTKAVLAELGVADYRRRSVRIRTRPSGPDEVRHLRMPASEPVMEVEVVNVDPTDRPVIYGSTAFCGSRIEFVLDL